MPMQRIGRMKTDRSSDGKRPHASAMIRGDSLPGRRRPEGFMSFLIARCARSRPVLGSIGSIRFIRSIRIALSVDGSQGERHSTHRGAVAVKG
jgi:hypothetical protein